MSASKLFTKQNRAEPASVCALVADRLADARANADLAELDYRREALLALQGSASDEAAAEGRLELARREVAKLEAVMLEANAQEAEASHAARAAQEAAQDAETIKAFDAWAETARAMTPAVEAYVAAYRAMITAGTKVRAAVLVNRRSPQLDGQHVRALVAAELARVAGGQPLPPGTDAWRSASSGPNDFKPIASHFAELAAAVRRELGHAQP